MTNPLPLKYDGDGMFSTPSAHWCRRADEQYVVGQTYAMEEVHERSSAAHARFFASLAECWHSLPDHLAAQFPTLEMFRKHGLIRSGFADKQTVPCSSRAEALRWAAVVQAIDTYAIVEIDGNVVTRWTAQSQSYRAMGKKKFHESADAVLEWAADLIGVTGGELARQGRAA